MCTSKSEKDHGHECHGHESSCITMEVADEIYNGIDTDVAALVRSGRWKGSPVVKYDTRRPASVRDLATNQWLIQPIIQAFAFAYACHGVQQCMSHCLLSHSLMSKVACQLLSNLLRRSAPMTQKGAWRRTTSSSFCRRHPGPVEFEV